jgi:hypothetical protein
LIGGLRVPASPPLKLARNSKLLRRFEHRRQILMASAEMGVAFGAKTT